MRFRSSSERPRRSEGIIRKYFERFSGIRNYLDSMVEFARQHGYVTTIFGRRRYIPELRERNFSIRAFGERTAANSPIQGSAADLIKMAMIRIHDALRTSGLEAKMLLQVHDELVFEVPTGELEQVKSLVKEQMEGAAHLAVPLLVDMGTGTNWLETKQDRTVSADAPCVLPIRAHRKCCDEEQRDPQAEYECNDAELYRVRQQDEHERIDNRQHCRIVGISASGYGYISGEVDDVTVRQLAPPSERGRYRG